MIRRQRQSAPASSATGMASPVVIGATGVRGGSLTRLLGFADRPMDALGTRTNWLREDDSNIRHRDSESRVLPTELSLIRPITSAILVRGAGIEPAHLWNQNPAPYLLGHPRSSLVRAGRFELPTLCPQGRCADQAAPCTDFLAPSGRLELPRPGLGNRCTLQLYYEGSLR